jgi:hypothetical protein
MTEFYKTTTSNVIDPFKCTFYNQLLIEGNYIPPERKIVDTVMTDSTAPTTFFQESIPKLPSLNTAIPQRQAQEFPQKKSLEEEKGEFLAMPISIDQSHPKTQPVNLN